MKSTYSLKAIIIIFAVLLICVSLTQAKYEPTWESLAKHPIPAWFEDGKFGIMIHWGPYSVAGFKPPEKKGYTEHFPKNLYREKEAYYPFMKEKFGATPPAFGYKDIIPLFKAAKFDPDKWADLFKKTGARYVIPTAEHHDGYGLWDSDITQWCATKIGPKRDLIGDLAKAVRAKGMMFGISYHRERHTGFFALEKYALKSPPQPDIAEEIKRHPEAAELYGPFEYSDAFIADYVARWKELERKYKPAFMWVDDVPIFYMNAHEVNDPQVLKFQDAFKHMIADYLNEAEKWGQQVYLNNKGRRAPNWPQGVGCREADNLKVDDIGPKWQNPATIGTSYGYYEFEEINDAYKSPEHLVHLLCDIVSKNGNLLLNIGPRSDGIIPDGMKRRLLAVGKWLEINGEAIYSTHPWKTFGKDNIRFTTKPNTLYAIALHWPEERA